MAGVRLVVVDGRWIVGLAVSFAVAVFAWALFASANVAIVMGAILLPMLVALAMVRAYAATLMRANREGIDALARFDHDAALRSFAAMAHGMRFRTNAAVALFNIAETCTRRGAFDEAATLNAAALECCPRAAPSALHDFGPARVRAHLATALACANRLDEADVVLRAVVDPFEGPGPGALRSVAAALIALRRGQPERALDELESTRTVRTNVSSSHAAALGEAVEAAAIAQLGGAYRGRTFRTSGVPWSDDVRAWVGRVVPGGDAYLARF
jgi:hypothetical protein